MKLRKHQDSGITIPTGTSFTITDGLASSSLPTDARLPTIPVKKVVLD